MTEEEKAICKKYSARDEEGLVHCKECPLVIDKVAFTCKASEELYSRSSKALEIKWIAWMNGEEE